MSYRFDDLWITETLRLRESLWGPLEDASEAGRARAQETSFPARVLMRARLLAVRERLDATLDRWRQIARLAGLLFIAGALLAGTAAAAAALSDGARPVNLAMALATLLGLNTFTFLFWLASFGMQAEGRGSFLADAWLRLTRRLARGPDAALVPRALMELLGRQRLTRWGAGVMSHGLWVLALLAALATLLVLLSTRRYTFQWETTLLSPDAFVSMVNGLGRLPAMLGFPQPQADLVRSSGGQQILPDTAHALWSGWLLGVVVVYGLIPRVAALLLSWIVVKRRVSRLTVDTSLPGIAELHERLMPASEPTGVDAPAPMAAPVPSYTHSPPSVGGFRAVAGIELPADLAWPLPNVPQGIVDLGAVDTREERRRLLEALRRQPAQRLLACCDARQTPDRGTLALLSELASLADAMRVVLLPDSEAATRREQWRQQLIQAGFSAEQLPSDLARAMAWLACTDPASGHAAGVAT